MIEFCTKKRMGAACVMLVIVSVVVLVIENNYSLNHDLKDVTRAPGNVTSECWEKTKNEVIKACAPCTAFEKKVHDYCKETGYMEELKCIYEDGKEVKASKSCPKLSKVEEQHFWVFESTIFLIGLGSYVVVHVRQRRLDMQLLDKINKQIAAGM